MIQRIQSVYLFLCGALLIASIFCPQIAFSRDDVQLFSLSALGTVVENTASGAALQTASHAWGVLTFNVLAAAMAFVAIFLYGNRRRQMRFISLLLLVILLLYITEIAYAWAFASAHDVSMAGQWGAILPFAAYIFAWLARRGVRHDEELVRSVERFR